MTKAEAEAYAATRSSAARVSTFGSPAVPGALAFDGRAWWVKRSFEPWRKAMSGEVHDDLFVAASTPALQWQA